jgi:hypothetical protein
MRQAIVRLALFVAVLLVLDRLVYAGAIYMRDAGGHPSEIDLIYDDGGWNPQIIFFGDSRTRRNFDMKEIERLTRLNAYDFGRDGASAEECLFMLQEYLRNYHRPQVVVFEADPMFLNQKWGTFNAEDFRSHVAVVPSSEELLFKTEPTLQERVSGFMVSWLIKSASIPNRLPALWQRWRHPIVVGGSTVQFYPCGPPERHLQCRYYNGSEDFVRGNGVEMSWQQMSLVLDEERMTLFDRVVSLAEQYRFHLLLLETPRLDEDKAYDTQKKAILDAFYCDLARGHSSVTYASITHVDDLDHDIGLYYDWAHFNGLGATKMSQLTAPVIKEILAGARPGPCLFE